MRRESKELQELLQDFREETYQKFNAKLIPTLPPEEILGIRTPILRKLAKELYSQQEDRMLQWLEPVLFFT